MSGYSTFSPPDADGWFLATVNVEVGIRWVQAVLVHARIVAEPGGVRVDIDREVAVTVPAGVEGTARAGIRGPHGAEIIAFPHRWPVLAGDTITVRP